MAKKPSLDELLEKFAAGTASRGTFKAIADGLEKNYEPPTSEHKFLASEIAKGIRNSLDYFNLNTKGRREALQYALDALKKSQISVHDLERIEAKLARAEIYTIYVEHRKD